MRIQHILMFQKVMALGMKGNDILGGARLGREHWLQPMWWVTFLGSWS